MAEQESPKRFLKKVLNRGPYYEVMVLLQNNPNWTVHGRVSGDNGHYVHWNSTTVELEIDGWLGDEPSNDDSESRAGQAVDQLQSDLKEEVQGWNKQLEKDLYAELEYNQSDEALTEWMDGNNWLFDEEGEQVDASAYLPVNGLQPGIRQKVIQQYADLFARTPDEVVKALLDRNIKFDKRGNRIDTTGFKPINELPPELQRPIFEKYRNILVEGDDFWAESTKNNWEEKLNALGFNDVEIRYSLGYSQGDGASFTAKSIDVAKLCKAMVTRQHVECQAGALANGIMS